VVLISGMDSLRKLILADDAPKLDMVLGGMRVVNDLSHDPTAFNNLLEEVGLLLKVLSLQT
jgi:hypothetical protein